MSLADMTEQNKALAKSVSGLGSAAHATGQDMEDLNGKLLSFGTLVRLGGLYIAKDALKSVMDRIKAERAGLPIAKERYETAQQEARSTAAAYRIGREQGTLDRATLALLKGQNKEAQATLLVAKKDYDQREALNRIITENGLKLTVHAAVLGAILTAWNKTVDVAHEYNRGLLQTDTNFATRYELINKTLTAQIELGASTRSMSESASALVEYGADLTPAFQENLKTVTMMKDGLGVAAHTGAEMVTIFSRQLRVAGQQVGDVIAQVAAQTGLAAEKAAQFATEIARSLRLLGPGLKTEAAGVLRVVEQLAGRVQEMGGNSGSIVNIFKRMSGGTSEAFFLRGLAGVRPGALGSEAGTMAAMRGLEARIQQIVTGPQSTEIYAVQLEAAAQMTGMSTNELLDFQQAMRELNAPLSESQSLTKAYQQQTALLGESYRQIREAVVGLITKAMMPLMETVTPISQALAGWIKTAAAFEPFVPILQITIPVAALASSLALVNLARSIWTVRGAAMLASVPGGAALKGLGQMAGLGLARTSLIGLSAGAGVAAGIGLDKLMDKMGVWASLVPVAGPIKIISYRLGVWYEQWKSHVDRQSIASGPNSRQVATAFGRELYQISKAGGSGKELMKRIDEFVASDSQASANPQAFRNYIAGYGKEVLKNQIMLSALAGPTIKSSADKAMDENNKLTAGVLQVLTDQLESYRRNERIQKEINQATQKTAKTAAEEAMPGAIWDFLPVDRISNRAAYQ